MREISNLGWPETPYGAAQRPHGRPTPILTAVSVLWARAPHAVPAAAAVTHLRVHRTRRLPVTGDTLSFGFHAAAPRSHASVLRLVGMLDRVLVQARRHAAILAGHQLLDDLINLQAVAGGMPTRGIDALVPAWPCGEAERRPTNFVDTSVAAVASVADDADDADGDDADDGDGDGDGDGDDAREPRTLGEACAAHRILVGGLPEGLPVLAATTLRRRHQAAGAQRDPRTADSVLTAALAHSLAIALIAADMRGKYRWDDPVDLAALLTREAWDHLPALAPAPAASRDAPATRHPPTRHPPTDRLPPATKGNAE